MGTKGRIIPFEGVTDGSLLGRGCSRQKFLIRIRIDCIELNPD